SAVVTLAGFVEEPGFSPASGAIAWWASAPVAPTNGDAGKFAAKFAAKIGGVAFAVFRGGRDPRTFRGRAGLQRGVKRNCMVGFSPCGADEGDAGEFAAKIGGVALAVFGGGRDPVTVLEYV